MTYARRVSQKDELAVNNVVRYLSPHKLAPQDIHAQNILWTNLEWEKEIYFDKNQFYRNSMELLLDGVGVTLKCEVVTLGFDVLQILMKISNQLKRRTIIFDDSSGHWSVQWWRLHVLRRDIDAYPL